MSTGAPSISGRIPGLDGIRAIAVCAVVWHHSHPLMPNLPLFGNGFLGVDVFFVLSGFLITTLLLREKVSHGKVSLRNFYWRRSLRIFPLYYLVLAALTLYFLLSPDSSQRADFLFELPFHLTYTSNWHPNESLMAISWSLSTEEQFYLVWPLLFVLLGRWHWLFVVPFLLLNQAINFGLLDDTLMRLGIPYGSLEILQCTFTPILLGVALACLLDSAAFREAATRLTPHWLSIALALAMLLVAAISSDMRGAPRLAFHILTALLLLAIVVHPQRWLARALEHRTLVYVGTISYGIYLLHMIAIFVCGRILQRFDLQESGLLFAGSLALSILMAGVSFRYFEAAFLRLKARYR